ncbi:hypothetical protein NTJ12_002265 [Flavobacterium psychrophilum]|nr:hypothetical protein [Flavobacterium psychrophilum]
MIYKSSKKLIENYEECEIFTNKYTENVKNKSEWIAEKGTHFKKPKKPPLAKTIAKCVVEYRPCKDWKGEFGIDWPRKNDSKMAVDIPYNGIIGKYGALYATDPAAVFTKDKKAYTNHLNQYDTFNCYKGKYYAPNVTLMQGETAFLDTITEVEEEPEKLHYVYDTEIFELTILKKLSSTKGKHFDEKSLKIKCLKQFTQKQSIRIIATKNKYLEKVGEIFVLPNNKVKNVNVLFIPVKYEIDEGSKVGNEIQITANALKQAYINPNIILLVTPIVAKGLFFDFFFTSKGKDGKTKMDTSTHTSIHGYLDEKFFETKENDIYKNHYRVFMLPASEKLNGMAEDIGKNAKAVVVYQNRNDSTTPHELMHAMGLYHTFDNNGLFTYKIRNTDNIMDYTHQIGKKRFSVNRWQWKILNPQIL